MPFAYIPYRLEIKDHPEFAHFPFNVMFGNTKVVDGKPTLWTALYEPDFSLYKRSDDGNIARMFYHNRLNRDWYLVIVWKNIEGKESYEGLKYSSASKEPVVRTNCDGDWNKFFTLLTVVGPVNGEACEIDPIP